MANEISLLISPQGLMASADVSLSAKDQARLDELLNKNRLSIISEEETNELNQLLQKVDELNLVKARAAVALHDATKRE